jgi:hypothetical protein
LRVKEFKGLPAFYSPPEAGGQVALSRENESGQGDAQQESLASLPPDQFMI